MSGRPILALAVIGALALLLLGCDGHQRSGTDGYRFDKAEWVATDLHLTLVLHPSLADLRGAASKARIASGPDEKLMGWGTVNANGTCTAHIVDPRVRYMPEYIGHEVTHCAFGRFHGAPVR